MEKYTDAELLELLEIWIGQLRYSDGRHWPLRNIGENKGVPSADDVISEVARRFREKLGKQ